MSFKITHKLESNGFRSVENGGQFPSIKLSVYNSLEHAWN
jgi:hypothetical protein